MARRTAAPNRVSRQLPSTRTAGAKRLSAKRTGGGGLGEPGGAAKRPVRASGPVEGVWGNREVPPACLDQRP
jgi:hypothetical protein